LSVGIILIIFTIPGMKHFRTFRALCAATAIMAALCFSQGAAALPAMDVSVEVLMAQGGDLKQTLNLNPNQQILWRQTEAKMRAILDERRHRRERLQADLKQGADNPRAELRDLAKLYDAETDLSYREDKQLRELFLTVNDALDDNQRQAVLAALNDQLQRVPDRGCDSKTGDQSQHARGMGHQRGAGSGSGGPPQQ
jgi:hypothetical protein